jgi:hypothetical protein
VKHTSSNTPIKINQDANFYATEILPSYSLTLEVASGRQGYLLCIEGNINITNLDGNHETLLDMYDAAELYGPSKFSITPTSDTLAHLLFVEVAYTGQGRGDLD